MNDDIGQPLVAGMVLPAPGGARSARRGGVVVAVLAAKLLCRLSPAVMRVVMSRLASGAQPASYAQAESAVLAVSRFSRNVAGRYGCLQRSVSACLLLRLDGQWAHWCVGVPTKPPFRAHAWIEADGQVVAELGDPSAYSRLISVPASPAR